MTFLLLLFAELIILFFLSRQLTRGISAVTYRLTRSQIITVYVLAFLFLPGTIIHELAHFFMATILFVPTGEIALIPKAQGDSVRLGSVAIAETDPFRRMLIGVAPFLVGGVLLLTLLFYTAASFESLPLWALIATGYGVFEIGNTMFSSKKDMEGTLEFLLALGALLGIGHLLGFTSPYTFLSQVADTQIPLLQQACLFLAVPLFLDLFLLCILYILTKIFKYG